MTQDASPRRIVGTPDRQSSVRQPTQGQATARVSVPSQGKWSPGPLALVATFRCGACDNPHPNKGKRLRRVRGLRTWVCVACDLRLSK